MLNISRMVIVLAGAAVIGACSSVEDEVKDFFDKDAVKLSDLSTEAHVVEYADSASGSTITDIYCKDGETRGGDQKPKGNWTVSGAVLSISENGATTDIDTSNTGNELRKGSTYDIGGGATRKVNSIKTTVCE